MKISKQITNRMEELATDEVEASFRSYCEQALAAAEREVGEIDEVTKAEIIPLARQAFEKGITPNRLSEILIQSQS